MKKCLPILALLLVLAAPAPADKPLPTLPGHMQITFNCPAGGEVWQLKQGVKLSFTFSWNAAIHWVKLYKQDVLVGVINMTQGLVVQRTPRILKWKVGQIWDSSTYPETPLYVKPGSNYRIAINLNTHDSAPAAFSNYFTIQ